MEHRRQPVPPGHVPRPARVLRPAPLGVPPAVAHARRCPSARLPVRTAVGDLSRGRDGGEVRQILQGPLEGDRGSRLRGDPGRLLPEPRVGLRVPRCLPLRARPTPEVDLLLPEDRDGTAHLPRGGGRPCPGVSVPDYRNTATYPKSDSGSPCAPRSSYCGGTPGSEIGPGVMRPPPAAPPPDPPVVPPFFLLRGTPRERITYGSGACPSCRTLRGTP